jgi:hypothetical protein
MKKKPFQTLTLHSNIKNIVARSRVTNVAAVLMEEWETLSGGN